MEQSYVDKEFMNIMRFSAKWYELATPLEMAAFDDRVVRTARHFINPEMEPEPVFNHDELMDIIAEEYSLSPEDKWKLMTEVEDVIGWEK